MNEQEAQKKIEVARQNERKLIKIQAGKYIFSQNGEIHVVTHVDYWYVARGNNYRAYASLAEVKKWYVLK